MKYRSKKIKKIKKKMIEYQSREDLDDNQLKRIEKLKRRREMLLSRGGKHTRSSEKIKGDATNKNIDKRYNTAKRAMERINGKRKRN